MSEAGSRKSSIKSAMFRRSILSLAMGISTVSAEESDSYDEALIAYLNDQYEVAMQHLEVSAGEGHAQSKYLLGTMYIAGLGADPDEYTGFRLCKEAAEAGIVDAQFQVGLMYWEGEGATENEDKAMKWLSLAASAGHEDAKEVLHVVLNEDFGFDC